MPEFTLLGYQKGLEEARGTLFYEFARLVQEIEPKAFVYENVQGLVKHDQGRTWEVVQRVFHSLGYTLHYQVLDAVNYNIPQKRRRIFVVGFKEGGEEFKFPEEKVLEYTMQDFCWRIPRRGVSHLKMESLRSSIDRVKYQINTSFQKKFCRE